jgi:uncharacterized protein YkwD
VGFLDRLGRLFRRPQPPPPPPPRADGAGVVELVNRERARHGPAPLAADARLDAAARGWAEEMARGGRLSHGNVGARIAAAGFRWTACAENVAQGQRTAAEVVADWMGSPGHRKNILSAAYTHAGAGRSGDFWCLVFAAGGA